MKRRSSVLIVAILLAMLALESSCATQSMGTRYEWNFTMDESQVKNGPEPDASTESPGTGRGFISYEATTNVLKYRIEWSGLVGRMSKLHVHGPATSSHSTLRHLLEFIGPPEASAEIARSDGAFEGERQLEGIEQDGFQPLSRDEIVAMLMSGEAYLNVHTTVFGMGEIRGNLGPAEIR
jgi:hypothetical protein